MQSTNATCTRADDLSVLKQHLRSALAAIAEEEQRTAAVPRTPATLAEVDALEAKLKESLEELSVIRQNLGRKGSNG